MLQRVPDREPIAVSPSELDLYGKDIAEVRNCRSYNDKCRVESGIHRFRPADVVTAVHRPYTP